MKRFAKALGILSALALIGAGFVSCGGDDSDPEPSVKITGGTSVKVGETIELTATASDFSDKVTFAWESTDTSEANAKLSAKTGATVTVTGVAKTESPITITVTATSGTQKATAKVTVTVSEATPAGGGSGETHSQTLAEYVATLSAAPANDTTAEGVKLADDYFTVSGKKAENTKWKNSGKQIELSKTAAGWIAFTVAANTTATVTITARSTKAGATTGSIALLKGEDAIPEKDGKVEAKDATEIEFVYENLAAGDYKFLTNDTQTGLRFTAVKAVVTSK